MQKNLPPAWVHPRSRVEYLSPVFLNLLISGSSPLTRGILLHAVEISRSCRFTPAHAGNTLLNQLNQSWYRVHPRSRGEYCPGKPLYLQFIGSPPLTRGIHRDDLQALLQAGFTPAHAGNTSLTPDTMTGGKVHPRSRGEYRERSSHVPAGTGSPPLTRGILTGWEVDTSTWRFTPAHAGNTSFFGNVVPESEVHPRSRGEYGKS